MLAVVRGTLVLRDRRLSCQRSLVPECHPALLRGTVSSFASDQCCVVGPALAFTNQLREEDFLGGLFVSIDWNFLLAWGIICFFCKLLVPRTFESVRSESLI